MTGTLSWTIYIYLSRQSRVVYLGTAFDFVMAVLYLSLFENTTIERVNDMTFEFMNFNKDKPLIMTMRAFDGPADMNERNYGTFQSLGCKLSDYEDLNGHIAKFLTERQERCRPGEFQDVECGYSLGDARDEVFVRVDENGFRLYDSAENLDVGYYSIVSTKASIIAPSITDAVLPHFDQVDKRAEWMDNYCLNERVKQKDLQTIHIMSETRGAHEELKTLLKEADAAVFDKQAEGRKTPEYMALLEPRSRSADAEEQKFAEAVATISEDSGPTL